jgi:hypothetical protein
VAALVSPDNAIDVDTVDELPDGLLAEEESAAARTCFKFVDVVARVAPDEITDDVVAEVVGDLRYRKDVVARSQLQ